MTYLLNFLGINYSNWGWIDFALFISVIFTVLALAFCYLKTSFYKSHNKTH